MVGLTRLYVIIFLTPFRISFGWNRWNYKSYVTKEWIMTWGFGNGPRGRKGHSLVVWNETKIVMFGGRDNDVHRHHVPKTFELVNDDEVLTFASYDGKPLLEEYDPTCQPQVECFAVENQTNGQNETCSYSWDHMLKDVPLNERQKVEETCGFTTTGLFYNDIWVYDMACTRFSDEPCLEDGWKVLHPGMRFGGCQTEPNDDRVCEIPSERWNHGAAMIDDSTMVVYGGYSHECHDYCDDVWAFDFDMLTWTRINIDSIYYPGKRWKSSMISVESMNETESSVVIFGGHRLWHGFAPDNSEENKWNSTVTFPAGGFLNDMWSLKKVVDLNDENNTEISWMWLHHEPKESCFRSPGIGWEERNRIECEILWPRVRSGHAAVYDKKRHGMWVHGGYAVHYPYPSSSSPGSDWGVKGRHERGFIPFGTQSYFLDDLWFFDFSSGLWSEIIPADSRFPRKRMEHIIVAHEDTLILHGGFSDNVHFNDTWYFNIEDKTWLEKTSYVHAFFPLECTDDLEQILNDKTCVQLEWPKPLRRTNESELGQEYSTVLPFSQQDGYTPAAENPLYFGIVDDAEMFISYLQKTYIENVTFDEQGNQKWLVSTVPDGTPIAPYAATGPRQYAKLISIPFNETLQLDIWEWCVSVKGEPTRHINHIQGEKVLIPQPRRQTVGWDGCRELRWVYPTSRSGHKAAFVEKYGKIVMYGGMSYSEADHESGVHPNTFENDQTYETQILNDMWTYGIDICPRNCSNHGDCRNGFCTCDPGYYGIDCSNITCPGTSCYYDDDHVQHCSHCCYDGFIHTDDNSQYMTGVHKIPCRSTDDGGFTGVSNGICDGFGSCQCAPPFIGEDCSVRDCPHDCYGNGLCSIEFPNARCICNPGFKGEYCQFKECLHNCSFPNGECDHTKGVCRCNKLKISSSPDKPEFETRWTGNDCSYIFSSCSMKCIRWAFITPFLLIFARIV